MRWRYVAYRHINGTIHVKHCAPSFAKDLLMDMDGSFFVDERTDIYDADTFEQAEAIAKERLSLKQSYQHDTPMGWNSQDQSSL